MCIYSAIKFIYFLTDTTLYFSSAAQLRTTEEKTKCKIIQLYALRYHRIVFLLAFSQT